MKKIMCGLWGTAALAMLLCLTACPQEPEDTVSSTPTATDTTVRKTTAVQKSVTFTLTSTNTGTWKVYSSETATAVAAVTAEFTAPNLTLTAAGTNLASGTYYVSVTEAKKTESGRLALIVANPVYVSVTGTVKANAAGNAPLSGAAVSISGGGLTSPITATTNAQGEYTLANVPSSTGYTVDASRTGYASRAKINYTASTDSALTVDFLLAVPTGYEFNVDDTSESGWSEGPVTTGEWSIVTEDNDTFVRIKRTSGNYHITNDNPVSGGTGQFTYEVRIRRANTTSQYLIFPFENKPTDWAGRPTAGSIVTNGTSLQTHSGYNSSNGNGVDVTVGSYVANTWYTIALYMDTTTQTFEFWVDGVKRQTSTGLSTFIFRRDNEVANPPEIQSISYFNIGSSDANTNFDVDYIRFYPYKRWEE